MEKPTGAKTLERGLELLDHVASGVDRLDGIAAAAGLSRSSTHRMLSSLVAGRYLSLGADNRYRLGLKLMELGAQTQRSLNLPEEIQVRLAEIAEATRDTTHLGILEADDVLYLAKARGSRGIEMASRPGGRLRAQNTAMGKMLLALRPRAEALARFDPSATITKHSITTVEDFDKELTAIRERGYSLDNQENELGIICVAIPIPDLSGEPIASISVSAPSVYMTEERISDLVALLNSHGPEITSCLPPGFKDSWD
ncbi:IclR family transcriptional regulator [Paeniglutamicibacter sp. ORCA_105]|uniref:IclR family transcriptional regulator n=1 Tax=Paeniglutamicibacter sp. ORCA_105 TaxID=3377336 RepID=UPI003893DD11